MGLGLFARKLRMTRLFDESGRSFAVTVVKVECALVSQIKTLSTDGYNAIQVAYNPKWIGKLSRSQLGLLKKMISVTTAFKNLEYLGGDFSSGVFELGKGLGAGLGFSSFGEFRLDTPEKFTVGERLTVDFLNVGQIISVKGTCIGKGFTGNQKRHNFSRGPMTHGSKNHRLPGSIGAGSTPSRVYPGKKMAGRMNNKMLKCVKSKIVFINEKEQVVVLKGSVPGGFNSLLKLECINFL